MSTSIWGHLVSLALVSRATIQNIQVYHHPITFSCALTWSGLLPRMKWGGSVLGMPSRFLFRGHVLFSECWSYQTHKVLQVLGDQGEWFVQEVPTGSQPVLGAVLTYLASCCWCSDWLPEQTMDLNNFPDCFWPSSFIKLYHRQLFYFHRSYIKWSKDKDLSTNIRKLETNYLTDLKVYSMMVLGLMKIFCFFTHPLIVTQQSCFKVQEDFYSPWLIDLCYHQEPTVLKLQDTWQM